MTAAAAGLTVAVIIAAVAPAHGSTPVFTHAAFDTVLAAVLHDGRVDYGSLARDPGALRRYLVATESADPDTWPRHEQIAFWVNAYNARVLDGVIRRPGLRSVLDVGKVLGIPTLGFFRERRRTAGAARSLNDIEHDILRRRYEEPRVHFVLNCASGGCPVLPAHPLTGATLEDDLARATRRFLADTTRNHLESGGPLELSAIFKWYADDFRRSAGSVTAWIARHAPWADVDPTRPVRYLPYDWSLNGTW